MRHFWDGLRIVLKNPVLWPLMMTPMVVAVVAYLALLIAGFSLAVPRMSEAAARLGLPEAVGWVTGSTLFALGWVVVSGPLFMILFSLVAVPVWDRLSSKVETLKTGSVPSPAFSFGFLVRDLPPRLCFGLGAAVVALVFGWIGFGLVGAAVSGWVMLYDLTAPACARRGVTFLGQPATVHRKRGWTGLWVTASLVALVPGLNVLCVPALVVAGTLLVLEGEGRALEPSAP